MFMPIITRRKLTGNNPPVSLAASRAFIQEGGSIGLASSLGAFCDTVFDRHCYKLYNPYYTNNMQPRLLFP